MLVGMVIKNIKSIIGEKSIIEKYSRQA